MVFFGVMIKFLLDIRCDILKADILQVRYIKNYQYVHSCQNITPENRKLFEYHTIVSHQLIHDCQTITHDNNQLNITRNIIIFFYHTWGILTGKISHVMYIELSEYHT